MRIVHVVLSLRVGGQERLILNLSRALRDRGHDVKVLCLTEGGGLRAEFGPIGIVDVPRRGGFEPSLVPRLFATFMKLRPDVVHTHNPTPLLYAAPAAHAAQVPCIVHTKHGANKVYTWKSLLAARAAVYAVTAFVPVSEETAQVARTLERVPDRKLTVIPNGIPLASFGKDAAARERLRAELGISRDATIVGTVGRLVDEKNYPLLVRAMGPLLGDATRLVIVGEGPSRPQIEAAIHALPEASRPFVHLTGERHDVPQLLAALDLFVLSSSTEGLPLVVPEAMASSLPVVATAVGGLPGIVPSHVGTLVPPDDERALRDAIAPFLTDAAGREVKAQAARTYAHQRFSIEEMTGAYERLYRTSCA